MTEKETYFLRERRENETKLLHEIKLFNSRILLVLTIQLLYTVKEKEGNLTENHTPFPMV
jgi:hypothetical protein